MVIENSKGQIDIVKDADGNVFKRIHRELSEDYNKKHGDKAKWGWYRYDARFALPVYSESNVKVNRKLKNHLVILIG